MLVEDLKAEECKSSEELRSIANIFIEKNEYTKDDLEHAIDWLLQSMIAMEKTHKRLKHNYDTLQESTANIKEAYEANLKNNQTLSNEAKGFAYKIWRYNKKVEVVNKIINELRVMFVPGFWARGKRIKQLIKELDTSYPNHDKLVDIDLDEVDAKVQKYMERPMLFDPKKISKEDFEKMMEKGSKA